MPHVESLLQRVRMRLAAAAAVEDLQHGLAWGGGVALGVVAAGRFGAEAATPELAAFAGVAVALAVPVGGALFRRVDARTLAARADERLGLRERLSTALWCASGGEPTGPFAPLVVADAESVAGLVPAAAVARAFRPRLLRRPLTVAVAALAATGALLLWQPAAQAIESPTEKAARLAEADRVAQVARKLAEAAKRVEEAAAERKEPALAKLAAQVRRQTEEMQKLPPSREIAMTQLNKLADQVKAEARREAGLRDASEATPEAAAQDKALADLLRDLASAGLESLQKDLAALEKQLDERAKAAAAKKKSPEGKDGKDGKESGDGKDGAESGPTEQDVRDLAARVDALRRAVERAQEAGASEVASALRTLGNEDVLRKIAERLRELAAKMESRGYEGLEPEDAADGDTAQMDEMSREELEELLRQLDELAGMDDLSQMLQEGGQSAGRGKKLKFAGGKPGGT